MHQRGGGRSQDFFTFFTEGMDIAMALEIDGDTVTGTMMSQYTVKGTRIE
ncbi:MAG: hypothetical protein R2751_00510 [Bacteroidales bacterium]